MNAFQKSVLSFKMNKVNCRGKVNDHCLLNGNQTVMCAPVQHEPRIDFSKKALPAKKLAKHSFGSEYTKEKSNLCLMVVTCWQPPVSGCGQWHRPDRAEWPVLSVCVGIAPAACQDCPLETAGHHSHTQTHSQGNKCNSCAQSSYTAHFFSIFIINQFYLSYITSFSSF